MKETSSECSSCDGIVVTTMPSNSYYTSDCHLCQHFYGIVVDVDQRLCARLVYWYAAFDHTSGMCYGALMKT